MAEPDKTAESLLPGGLTYQTVICLAFTLAYYIINFLSNLFFARNLGEALYGDFSFMMSAIILGSQVILLGAEESTQRFIPNYLASGHYKRIHGFVQFFLVSTLIVATVSIVCVWMLILESDIDGPFPPHIETTIRTLGLVALCIPIYAMAELGQKVLRSFGMLARSYIPNRLVAPLATLAVVAIAVWFDLRLSNWTVAFAIMGGSGAALALQCILFYGAKYADYVRNKPEYEVRIWLSFSVPMMFSVLMWKLTAYGDIMMVELIGETEEEVGLFAAAQSTTLLLSAVYVSILTVIAPIISVAARDRSRRQLQDLCGKTVTIMLGTALVLCSLAIVFRHQIMGVFGPEYLPASDVLVLLTIAMGTSIVLGPGKIFLDFLGRPKLTLWPTGIAAIANIIADAILIPIYGIQGAAASTLVILLGCGLAWVTLLYRAEGLIALPLFGRLRPGHHQ